MRFTLPLLAAGILTTGPATAGNLDFMTGHWRSAPGPGNNAPVSEEIWTDGAGGIYLGVNRTLVGDRAQAFEFLRIVRDEGGETRYCAQPGGEPGACFRLVEAGDRHAVFENPDHDFPQRIRYARSDDVMTATISDLAGEQSFSFEWSLVVAD